jgi:hypothetical protein
MFGRHASVLSLVVLGTVVGLGLSGALGGGRVERRAIDNAAVELAVRMPAVVRSGEMLETRVQVVAHKRIAQLVIGIDPALWRELTTNSQAPEPQSESYADGLLRLDHGALESGEKFDLQISQQVNPRLFGSNRGRIVVLDGARRLAELELDLKVLP